MSAEATQKTAIRLPADLHAELVRCAERQGVSLNLLMVSLLAGAVGFKLRAAGKGDTRHGRAGLGRPGRG